MRLGDAAKMVGIPDINVKGMFATPKTTNSDLEKQHLEDIRELERAKIKETRKVLFSWKALSRPPRRGMNAKATKTLMIIGGVIALLLVAMQEFFLILVVLSLIFMSYLLTQLPPEEVSYEISDAGFMYNENFYYWDELKQFFFMHADELEVLAIDTLNRLPARIFATVESVNKNIVKEHLEKYIYFIKEPPKTSIDKAYETFMGKLNLG